jgi:AcrR family transcriptional regulator
MPVLMSASTTGSGERRTQAERSAATVDALLDATIECLVEDGYANTTTSRVAERAGVSRGAHLHHFQTRSALVAAAIERLSALRAEQGLALARELPEGRERIGAGLDLIWSGYDHQFFQAAIDLWSHARTDPELRGRLVEVERTFDRQTLEIAARVFPGLAGKPGFEPLIEMALATMRGLALLNTLSPGSDRAAKQWVACRAELVAMFERQA